MPVGVTRLKTLYGLAKKRGSVHRYTWIRWAVGIAFTAGVALLPLTGVLRIDLWSGEHLWLGEEVGLIEAIKAFAFPFLAINIAIIVASRFIGRYLCGFVCPIGALNRLDEWFAWRWRKGRRRWLAHAIVFVACALLAAVAFSFWSDWRVFAKGSPAAVTVAGVGLGGTTLVLFGTVRGLGMRFCRDYCPSGVYFAVLGPTSMTTVEFAHPEECTDCGACEKSCPVDLTPRELAEEGERPGMGFYPANLSDYALCLRCGDCVAACEDSTPGPTPLRLGFKRAPAEEPAKSEGVER